jgi:hypothetical protein
MYDLILESGIAGLLTFIIGTIIFNLTLNKNNKDSKKPDSINIAFFATGVVLNLFLTLSGFNKWYCDKECLQQCAK